jgi:hypothetical protein
MFRRDPPFAAVVVYNSFESVGHHVGKQPHSHLFLKLWRDYLTILGIIG